VSAADPCRDVRAPDQLRAPPPNAAERVPSGRRRSCRARRVQRWAKSLQRLGGRLQRSKKGFKDGLRYQETSPARPRTAEIQASERVTGRSLVLPERALPPFRPREAIFGASSGALKPIFRFRRGRAERRSSLRWS
jgi:hypothetical protein